jgi:hypothetical protein
MSSLSEIAVRVSFHLADGLWPETFRTSETWPPGNSSLKSWSLGCSGEALPPKMKAELVVVAVPQNRDRSKGRTAFSMTFHLGSMLCRFLTGQ